MGEVVHFMTQDQMRTNYINENGTQLKKINRKDFNHGTKNNNYGT